MSYENFLGRRHGSFSVISEVPKRDEYRRWVIRCDCGFEKEIRSGDLRRDRRIRCDECAKTYISRQRFYMTWLGMIGRCYKEKNKDYANYGARGITICKEWKDDFYAFQKWAELNWRPNTTLDRKDNSIGYSPDNCRFGTPKQQANNRRNNVQIEIGGVSKTKSEWCHFYGKTLNQVRARLHCGWDIESALKEPIKTQYGIKRISKV